MVLGLGGGVGGGEGGGVGGYSSRGKEVSFVCVRGRFFCSLFSCFLMIH